MITPRRVVTYLAGAAATITLVAVGPGGLAFGAQTNPNDAQSGQRGQNSASTPHGTNASGESGVTGRRGQSGRDGGDAPVRRVDRSSGDGGDVDVSVPDGDSLAANIQRRVQAQVRRANAQARRATNAGKHKP